MQYFTVSQLGQLQYVAQTNNCGGLGAILIFYPHDRSVPTQWHEVLSKYMTKLLLFSQHSAERGTGD